MGTSTRRSYQLQVLLSFLLFNFFFFFFFIFCNHIFTFWVLVKMKFFAAKLMLLILVLDIMVQANETENRNCGGHFKKCCRNGYCRNPNWCCKNDGICRKGNCRPGLKDTFLASVHQIERK